MRCLELDIAVTDAPFVWTRPDKISLQGIPMYEREAVNLVKAGKIAKNTKKFEVGWAVDDLRINDAQALPNVTESYKKGLGLALQVMSNTLAAMDHCNYRKRGQFEDFALAGSLAFDQHCRNHGLDEGVFLDKAVEKVVFSR